MRVFLDFEASSLRDEGYPIEVGWVFETGEGEGRLIRPAPGWTDWDPAAEAVHGLSRQRLEVEGEPHDAVARRMVDQLTGHALYATAPSWDGKWLSLLLRTAGFPRRALQLRDSDQALLEAAAEALQARAADSAVSRAPEILAQARAGAAKDRVAHRALDDARHELTMLHEVRRLAARVSGG